LPQSFQDYRSIKFLWPGNLARFPNFFDTELDQAKNYFALIFLLSEAFPVPKLRAIGRSV